MGLSIHYSGRLRQPEQEPALTAEVADICRDLGWNYTLLHRKGDGVPLQGIAVAPEGSEPLFLTFLPDGRLLSPIELMLKNDPHDPCYYTIHTKTQFAGVDTHKAFIKLLQYLGTRYFAALDVQDEGMYWESGDEELLRSQFHKYTGAIDDFTAALKELPDVPGESTESLADRIEKLYRDKFGPTE